MGAADTVESILTAPVPRPRSTHRSEGHTATSDRRGRSGDLAAAICRLQFRFPDPPSDSGTLTSHRCSTRPKYMVFVDIRSLLAKVPGVKRTKVIRPSQVGKILFVFDYVTAEFAKWKKLPR